jgi:hypothetical protein
LGFLTDWLTAENLPQPDLHWGQVLCGHQRLDWHAGEMLLGFLALHWVFFSLTLNIFGVYWQVSVGECPWQGALFGSKRSVTQCITANLTEP